MLRYLNIFEGIVVPVIMGLMGLITIAQVIFRYVLSYLTYVFFLLINNNNQEKVPCYYCIFHTLFAFLYLGFIAFIPPSKRSTKKSKSSLSPNP